MAAHALVSHGFSTWCILQGNVILNRKWHLRRARWEVTGSWTEVTIGECLYITSVQAFSIQPGSRHWHKEPVTSTSIVWSHFRDPQRAAGRHLLIWENRSLHSWFSFFLAAMHCLSSPLFPFWGCQVLKIHPMLSPRPEETTLADETHTLEFVTAMFTLSVTQNHIIEIFVFDSCRCCCLMIE